MARASGEISDALTLSVAEQPVQQCAQLDLRGALRDIGDADLFATMAGMLVAEWDEHVSRVHKALLSSDVSGLRMHAHTLKSLLAMFHAETARREAMDLESAAMVADKVDWPACQAIYARLAEEMARLRPIFQQYLDTRVIP